MNAEIMERGMDHICARDARMAAARRHVGDPEVRTLRPGLGGLIHLIAGQQISNVVAARLRERISAHFADRFDAAEVAATSMEVFRSLGLSQRKAEYIRGVAEQALSGALDLEALADADAETVVERLTALRGVGRWTAEIYCLFCLGHPDIFPMGDLVLLKTLGLLYGKDPMGHDGKPLPWVVEVTDPWAPFRSVGAHFLWHHHRNVKREKSQD